MNKLIAWLSTQRVERILRKGDYYLKAQGEMGEAAYWKGSKTFARPTDEWVLASSVRDIALEWARKDGHRV